MRSVQVRNYICELKLFLLFCVVVISIPLKIAAAPVVLTLSDSPVVQQASTSPCIIGNPSCNNPALFPTTIIPANAPEGTLASPEYTIDLIRSIVGDFFYVGIDLQEPDEDYGLDYFNLTIDSKIEFEYQNDSPILLQNHGNGFSDYVLRLFDISAFQGSSIAVFNLIYSDAQAAREQFFLAAARSSAEVPEPGSVALLISGLSAALLRKRKNKLGSASTHGN